MSRLCTVCSHEKRAEIDRQIVAGQPFRAIACTFSIGRMSVERHASAHIAQQIKQSQAAAEEAQSLDIVRQLNEINRMSHQIMSKAGASVKTYDLCLKAIDRIMKQLELQAKINGDIDTSEVRVNDIPEWRELRTLLVQALAEYPEAKMAIVRALQAYGDVLN